MRDEKDLRHIVQLARDEVNRQNAPLALQYLNEIRADIDEYAGTLVWAEHQLTFAETLASMRDPILRAEALPEFEEAARRVSNLPERHLELELRAHEHFAMFLASSRRRSVAKTHYELATRAAVEAGLKQETARVQLKMIKNDLECDESPLLPSLRNFRKAASEKGSTPQQQLAAWLLYVGENEELTHSLVAARKGPAASVEYFRDLLNSVK